MPIPPDLFLAVSAGEANLAVVIGAGCSMEAPTSLPSARQLSQDVSRRLVEDGVVAAQDLDDPDDLSSVASAVFDETGSVSELVKRMPIDRMRGAAPNSGYLLVAALLHERVISHVLSLNFDLALQNAAAFIGVQIHTVDRVGQAVPAVATVVQLHGSASGPEGELVLRVEDLSEGWRGAWHEVIATQVLAAPHVLFVGLGSPAPVLSETVAFIVDAVGGGKSYYQADVVAHALNGFATALGIAIDRYMQLGWTALMEQLASRVAAEQIHRLRTRGSTALIEQGHADAEIARFQTLVDAMAGLGLLSLGKFRSHAKLATNTYLAAREVAEEHLAGPMFSLAAACETLELTVEPAPNGIWIIKREGVAIGTALVSSGLGYRTLRALEPGIRFACDRIGANSIGRPDIVLVAAATAAPEVAVAPLDIVNGDDDPSDIMGAPSPEVLLCEDANICQKLSVVLNVH